jgi:hypothetical protein
MSMRIRLRPEAARFVCVMAATILVHTYTVKYTRTHSLLSLAYTLRGRHGTAIRKV